jgi:hypothetical protein
MRTWRWYSKLLFALLVAAFAYLVWPGPWHYVSTSSAQIVRVHRLTGRTERLSFDGWREVKPTQPVEGDPELAAIVAKSKGPWSNVEQPTAEDIIGEAYRAPRR